MQHRKINAEQSTRSYKTYHYLKENKFKNSNGKIRPNDQPPKGYFGLAFVQRRHGR